MEAHWEYMHSTAQIADKALRAEVYGVPEDQRLMRLTRHHDRLLNILKERDLHKNVAFVEPHNEANISDFPKQKEGKPGHEEAIAFLRVRNPDILITGDMAGHHPNVVPENTQVYDNHMYVGKEALHRKLPIVMDEGGFFIAPLNSRWEESEQGLAYLEHLYSLAIEHHFWGFLPTSYNGPEAPIWYAHPNWLKQNNTRFLKG